MLRALFFTKTQIASQLHNFSLFMRRYPITASLRFAYFIKMLRVSHSQIVTRSISHARPIRQLNLNPSSAVYVKPPSTRVSYTGPILFGITATTSIFFGAGFIHEREKENFWQRLKRRTDGPRWSTIRDIIIDDKLILADLWEEKKKMWLEKKQAVMEDMKKRLDQYNSIPIEIKRVFLAGAQTYLSMSEAEKTMAGLIGINLLVFGAWRIPTLQPIMNRYFMHNPSSGRSITLFTSCFSHKHILPLTLNMVALWSIGPLLHDVLGKEQFVAMYLSLGINANVVSHILRAALRHKRPIVPTLGASGGIYGLLAGAAFLYPDSSVFIPFVPTIPIQTR